MPDGNRLTSFQSRLRSTPLSPPPPLLRHHIPQSNSTLNPFYSNSLKQPRNQAASPALHSDASSPSLFTSNMVALAESITKINASARELRSMAAKAKSASDLSTTASARALNASKSNMTASLPLQSVSNRPPSADAIAKADRLAASSTALSKRANTTAANTKRKADAAQRQLNAAIITAGDLQRRAANFNNLQRASAPDAVGLSTLNTIARRTNAPNRSAILRSNPFGADHSYGSICEYAALSSNDPPQLSEKESDADSPSKTDETRPGTQPKDRRIRKPRPNLNNFPLQYPKTTPEGPALPPYLSYNLEASYCIDGSSVADASIAADPSRPSRSDRSKQGACAFVKYTPLRVMVYAAKVEDATNNAAEFLALEEVLKDAVKSEHRTILITTDSQLTFDLLIDAGNRITKPHLKTIADRIQLLLKSAITVYASKVFSHRDETYLGNQVADAMCTWAVATTKTAP